jgi:hypothetical protein
VGRQELLLLLTTTHNQWRTLHQTAVQGYNGDRAKWHLALEQAKALREKLDSLVIELGMFSLIEGTDPKKKFDLSP